MKWIQASQPSDTLDVFHLVEGEETRGILRYNSLLQSVRISSGNEHRLFFIKRARAGKRFRITNEYGFDVGKLELGSTDAGDGTIEIGKQGYHYRLFRDPAPELAIYSPLQLLPALTCQLLHWRKETLHEYAGLLLGLCVLIR